MFVAQAGVGRREYLELATLLFWGGYRDKKLKSRSYPFPTYTNTAFETRSRKKREQLGILTLRALQTKLMVVAVWDSGYLLSDTSERSL